MYLGKVREHAISCITNEQEDGGADFKNSKETVKASLGQSIWEFMGNGHCTVSTIYYPSLFQNWKLKTQWSYI